MNKSCEEILDKLYNSLELGIIVIDNNDNICMWNDFMVSYSNISREKALGVNLFKMFTNLPKIWMKLKFKGVRNLKNVSKVSWEQRPVLFEFTGGGTMLQDCTFIPVSDDNHICIVIDNVTAAANVKIELQELIEINKSLEKSSSFDFLTEVYNREYIVNRLKDHLIDYKVKEFDLTAIIIDLDDFKRVNDTYGHLIGDRVLKHLCQLVNQTLTDKALFGRYGGEEFLLIFSERQIDDILLLLETLRKKISSDPIKTREGDLFISASFGVAQMQPEIKDDLELLHRADVALYKSKNNGKNCITLY